MGVLDQPVLVVLLVAALPTAGTVAGWLLSERFALTKRQFGLIMHLAAGGVSAVVAVELLPRALAGMSMWITLGAFLLGGAFIIGVDWLTDFVSETFEDRPASDKSPWVLMAGIAVDLVTDGIMIGAGAVLDVALALLLGLGLLFADLFEGFAAFATLRRRGVSPGIRAGVALGVSAIIPVVALGGYRLLRPRPEWWSLAILAWTAGVLLTLIVEEMAPRADVGGDGRWMTAAFLAGFTTFAGLAAVLG